MSALTRTQKKRQDQILAEWLVDHRLRSVDDFLDNYRIIQVTDPEILEDLNKRLNSTPG